MDWNLARNNHSDVCAHACEGRPCTCLYAAGKWRRQHKCHRCCGCTHFSTPMADNAVWTFQNRTRHVARLSGHAKTVVFAAWAVDGSTPRQIVRTSARSLYRHFETNASSPPFEPSIVAKARLLSMLVRACSLQGLFRIPAIQPLRTGIPLTTQTAKIPKSVGQLLGSAFGVLLEEAPGSSLASLGDDPSWITAANAPLLDSQAVVAAAIFDTLLNNRDRSFENIMLSSAQGSASSGVNVLGSRMSDSQQPVSDEQRAVRASSRLAMIDNVHNALDYGEPHDGEPASVMLPTSRLYGLRDVEQLPAAVQRMKERHAPWIYSIDFRCHAPGGVVGRRYPASLRRCLSQAARDDWGVEDVVILSDGLDSIASALRKRAGRCCYTHAACVPPGLRERAQMMLRLGFEGTLAAILPHFANRTAPMCR